MKTITLSPSLSYFGISSGYHKFRITISTIGINDLDRIFRVKIRIQTSNTLHAYSINNVLIDLSILDSVDGIDYAFLDVTNAFFNSFSSSVQLYIYSPTMLSNFSTNVEIQFITPFEKLTYQNYTNYDVGKELTLKVNNATSFFRIKKVLFSGQCNLVFDSYYPNEELLFFPKGWKIDYLERIDVNSNDLLYVDSEYNRHVFIPTSITNKYVDQSGTTLFLEKIYTSGTSFYYKMYSPLSYSFKEFNSDGNITSIYYENGDTTFIAYPDTSSIIITKPNNDQITITKSSGSISITHSSYTKTYTLLISSQTNRMAALSLFTYSNVTGAFIRTNRVDSFSYDNNGRIVESDSFDNYKANISYNSNNGKLSNVSIETNNDVVLSSFGYEFSKDITKITNEKEISISYIFDENNKIVKTINSGDDLSKKCIDEQDYYIDERDYLGSHLYYILNSQCSSGGFIASGTNNTSQIRKVFYSEIPTIQKDYYFLMVRVHQKSTIPFTIDDRKIRLSIYQSNRDYTIVNEIITGNITSQNYIKPLFNHDFKYIKNEYSHSLYIFSKSIVNQYIHQDLKYFYVAFDIPSNVKEYLISDVFIVGADADEIIPNRKVVQLSNGNIDIDSLSNATYIDKMHILSCDNLLYKSDIAVNQLLAFKNNGSTETFFTDDLTNVILGQNSLQVYQNSQNNSDFFINYDFAFINQNSRLIKEFNVLSSFNSTQYKKTTYKIKGTNVYSKHSINDYRGNVIEETDYKGLKTNNTFNSSYDLVSSVISIDSNNPIIENDYSFDNYHRLVSESYKIGSNDNVTVLYTYNSHLNVLSTVTDGKNKVESYSYSTNHEYQSSISKSNCYIKSYFDDKHELFAVSDGAISHRYFFDYDDKKRISCVFYRGSSSPGYETFIDPYNNSTYSKRKLVTISRTEDTNYNTSIVYSYLNTINTTEVYDKHQRLLSKSNSGNSNYIAEFTYTSINVDGKVSSISDNYPGQLTTTTYSYNEYKQPSSITIVGEAGTINKAYTYDDYQNVTREEETISGSSFNQVNNTKVLKKYHNDDITDDIISAETSANSSNNSLIAGLVETKTIDSLNRLSSIDITWPGSTVSLLGYSFSYHVSNNKTSNHIIEITNTHNNGYYSYSYDKNGNIVSSNEYGAFLTSYSYDDNNQIIQETLSYDGPSFIYYTYDNYGNILSVVKKNLMGQVIESHSFTYSSIIPNRLSSYDNVSISYSNLHNPISLDGASLSYVRVNMLSSYSKGTTNASYFYNYEGIRTKKVVNNEIHHYILNGHKISREIIEQTVSPYDKRQIIYLYGISGVIGFVYNSTCYLYEKDIFNNITRIYQKTSNGLSLTARYLYDAFGNTIVLDASGVEDTNQYSIGNINPFRYRSYYFDRESGYYYCNHRYYVPFIRRWLTMDDTSYLDASRINGINLFAYCNNNPIMNVDPEGNSFLVSLFAGLIAGAIVGAAAGALTAAATNQNIFVGLITGAVGGAIIGAGAGIGSWFLAPVFYGGTTVIASHALSKGLAVGIGLGIGFLSGAVGGAAQDIFSQLWNNDFDWNAIDPNSIFDSAIKNGVFNMLGTLLGGTAGPDLGGILSFLIATQQNVIPSGYTTISDIIKWYIEKRKAKNEI